MKHTLMFVLTPRVSEGELKTPSVSIPKGTIVAVFYTFTVYVLLFVLVSATCDRFEILKERSTIKYMTEISSHLLFPPPFRTLLIQDYGFLQKINIWPPFVTIGIYCASLSAAMCTMIGASRILHALALDHLFGEAFTHYISVFFVHGVAF